MKTFKDADNNEFTLRLSYGAVQRVQSEMGLDLRYPVDPDSQPTDIKPSLVSRLFTDPFLFVEMLMVLIRDDLQRLTKVTPEFWRDNLDAATIGTAREAFFAEWSDFFHGLNTSHLAETMSAEIDLIRKAGAAAAVELSKVDPAAEIRKKLESISTGLSGSGAGSSESIRAA